MNPTVVHLVERLEVGGMERVIQRFASARRESGGKVRVLCTQEGGVVAEEMRSQGIWVEVLKPAPRTRPAQVRALIRSLGRSRPFLLHTHGAVRPIGRIAGRLAGARAVIHHLHGTEIFGVRQRLFERTCPATLYLACSEAIARWFRDEVGDLPTEVLYNPVDTRRFRSAPALRRKGRGLLGVPDSRPLVLTVGRFVDSKGQREWVRTIPKVLQDCPEVLFVFIGDGPLRAEVERLASALPKRVRFLDPQDNLVPYFNACDVYVQPSIGREGLGLSILEAMACERAVVATGIEGIPEAVGDAGILAPQRDFDTLAKSIIMLLNHPDRRSALGIRARERVVKGFSLDVISRRLEEIYRSLYAG